MSKKTAPENPCRLINTDSLINFAQNQKSRTVDANDIARFPAAVSGIPLSRLRELVQADKDGRCIIPLAIGAKVYAAVSGDVFEFLISEYSLIGSNNGNIRYWADCITGIEDDLDFWADDIGKTVFLTREAAEAALKGGEKE